MISHIHHINFLVRDLHQAVKQYQRLLGGKEFIFDPLEGRKVITARVKLGETWLVLVQPVNKEGVPAKHLEKHGEGFFLLSLGTDNLEQQLDQLAAQNFDTSDSKVRQGLDNWQVADLSNKDFSGVQLQLTKESSSTEQSQLR